MDAFVGDIEKLTEKNRNFREVLSTGKYTQLVVMCLQPGEEIGNEVHEKVDYISGIFGNWLLVT